MPTSIKVFLREKKISKGRKSLYLDFYPEILNPNTGKKTRREFLGLYIFERSRGPHETQHNKETKALARSIKNKREKEIQEGTYGFSASTNKKKSFIEFFDLMVKQRYASDGNYGNWHSASKYLKEFFSEGLTMGQLSVEVLEDFKEYLSSLKLAQNTKHSYFNKLKAALKEAFKKGYIPENYGARVNAIKAEETKREFLTIEELKTLAQAPCENEVMKKAFLFSALTGLRFVDVNGLTWNDLQKDDANGYFIRLRQQKTKAEETLPIPISARELLGSRQGDDKKIFEGLKYSAWNNVKLQEWVFLAGIRKKITFHCARHSFAIIQMNLGTGLYTVSKLLGHKDVRTTQIYAKIVDERKTEAMNKLNDIKL